MDNIPYFSIIVPAYQAEKTIGRCIDSIISQSFNDYELIIINDGSTDNTYRICKEYDFDDRIRIISQKNKGISATRQLGLNLSKGKYIQFIDSDDWVDTLYFEDIYNLLDANNYDIVLLDYYAEKINYSKYTSLGIKSLDRKDIITGLVVNIPGVLWNKVIKRELFYNNNIGFNSGLSYCEDWVVSYELFNLPVNIHYYNKAFYHYDLYSNTNSLARVINEKTLKNRCEYLEYIKQLGIRELYPNVYETQCAAYAYIIIRSNLFNNHQFNKIFSEFRLNNTYLSLYKKMILKIAGKMNVRVAHCLDSIIRKILCIR